MSRCAPWLLGCVVLGATGCGAEEAAPQPKRASPPVVSLPALTLTPVDLGAGAGSGSPRLQAGAKGRVAASWLEPAGDGVRLRWRPTDGEAAAHTVVEGAELLQNWADIPAVAVLGPQTRLALWPAHHPERGPEDGVPGYGLRWARQVSPGSWEPSAPLALDTRGPEYGFVSVAALDTDHTAVFWLDGRASNGHHGGQMQLRSAVVTPEGITDRRLVDGRVCDCCQTSAAPSARGAVVAYRDRSDTEVRDIWLAGPAPQQRRRVGADDWRLEGCPVNGPAVTVHGDRTAVAWFSAAQDTPRVQVAFAQGDGPFGDAVRVDGGQPVGRVDAIWIEDRRIAVSWIEQTSPTAAEIRVRVVGGDGMAGPAMLVAPTTPDRRSGFPQLEREADAALLWAWTDAPEGARPQVRFGRAAVAALLGP